LLKQPARQALTGGGRGFFSSIHMERQDDRRYNRQPPDTSSSPFFLWPASADLLCPDSQSGGATGMGGEYGAVARGEFIAPGLVDDA
jgi:hypothetical protein